MGAAAEPPPRGAGASGGAPRPLELVPPRSRHYIDWVVLSFPWLGDGSSCCQPLNPNANLTHAPDADVSFPQACSLLSLII